MMDSYTAEEARYLLDDLIRHTVQERKHCRITSAEGEAAIVIPEETYHNLAVTLELLSTPGLMRDVNLDLMDLEHDVAVVGRAVS